MLEVEEDSFPWEAAEPAQGGSLRRCVVWRDLEQQLVAHAEKS